MSEVIGLAFHEDRIDCAIVRRRLGAPRGVEAFSLAADESPEAALRGRLRELRVRTRHTHVAIPRRRAIVKVIELPAVAGADLRRMIGFELERHLPFAPSEAIFDYLVLEQAAGRPVRVLLVAVERRVVDRIEQVLREGGLEPRLVDVGIHSLAALAARGAKDSPGTRRVVVHAGETEAEIAIVRGGRPLWSRAFPLPQEARERDRVFAAELRRSLESLTPDDRRQLQALTVTGEVPGVEWADLPPPTELALPAGVAGSAAPSVLLPVIATALRTRRGVLRTNLLPERHRPRSFPWPVAVTAALGAAVVLLALAVPGVTALRAERALKNLTQRAERFAPEVREIEQLVAAVERGRREVATLRAFEAEHIQTLPILRELTELLPADAWLTNLSIDGKGIELAGFAGAASQLIPLLEASPTFERAEFTSPVTKGQDREQFRLKTALERGATDADRPTRSSPPAATPGLGSQPRAR